MGVCVQAHMYSEVSIGSLHLFPFNSTDLFVFTYLRARAAF